MYSHILLCGAHRPVLAAASRWAAAGVEYQDRSLKKAWLHSQSSDTASSLLPFRNCKKKKYTHKPPLYPVMSPVIVLFIRFSSDM